MAYSKAKIDAMAADESAKATLAKVATQLDTAKTDLAALLKKDGELALQSLTGDAAADQLYADNLASIATARANLARLTSAEKLARKNAEDAAQQLQANGQAEIVENVLKRYRLLEREFARPVEFHLKKLREALLKGAEYGRQMALAWPGGPPQNSGRMVYPQELEQAIAEEIWRTQPQFIGGSVGAKMPPRLPGELKPVMTGMRPMHRLSLQDQWPSITQRIVEAEAFARKILGGRPRTEAPEAEPDDAGAVEEEPEVPMEDILGPSTNIDNTRADAPQGFVRLKDGSLKLAQSSVPDHPRTPDEVAALGLCDEDLAELEAQRADRAAKRGQPREGVHAILDVRPHHRPSK